MVKNIVKKNKITDEQLESIASSLIGYLKYEQSGGSYFDFANSISSADNYKPSIYEAYRVFSSLPPDHSLRKKYDLKTVHQGYNIIYNSRAQKKSCESLLRFILS